MRRAGCGSPTPPQMWRQWRIETPECFPPPIHKPARAAGPEGEGEGERESHRGGAGRYMAASVAGQGDAGKGVCGTPNYLGDEYGLIYQLGWPLNTVKPQISSTNCGLKEPNEDGSDN